MTLFDLSYLKIFKNTADSAILKLINNLLNLNFDINLLYYLMTTKPTNINLDEYEEYTEKEIEYIDKYKKISGDTMEVRK